MRVLNRLHSLPSPLSGSTVAAELLEFPLERRPIPAISVAFDFLLGSQRRHEPRFAPGSRMLEQRPQRLQFAPEVEEPSP